MLHCAVERQYLEKNDLGPVSVVHTKTNQSNWTLQDATGSREFYQAEN